MILIFGGAYQGKYEYARDRFKLNDEEVWNCPREADCSTPEDCLATLSLKGAAGKRAVYGLQNFVYACAVNEINAFSYIKSHMELLSGKIIIMDDVSQGIVPVDKTERAFREMNGRIMVYLAGEADEVVRVFCGLPQILKGGEE